MAYFDSHTARVPKIDAPLLVIGLGGTGADGLLRIKSEFSQRLIPDVNAAGDPIDRPPRTAYLEIDTDADDAKRKRYHGVKIDVKDELIDLSCDIRFVLGSNGGNLDPTIKRWLDRKFYTDQDLIEHAATDGAGTYRQLSRLMLFRNSQVVVSKLNTIMTKLSTVSAGAPIGRRVINVVICTGLSGGTGSGTFLDMAYLVRHAAEMSHFDVKLDLYAVAPDVTINKQAIADPTKSDIYKTNSFAAMKELDYWMAYNDRKDPAVDEENYQVDYGNNIVTQWNHVPYDDVTLLCAMNEQGALLENAYNVVMNSMAEVLLFQMAGEAENHDYVGQNNETEDDSFTFQSQRSNEHAYRRHIHRKYPENYCYRTVGAYSTLGEQRNKVSIEADMIFRDVQSFSLAPEQLPVMNGNDPARFEQPFDDYIIRLYNDFTAATAFNEDLFTGAPPYSLKEVKVMSGDSAPHGLYTEWVQSLRSSIPHLKKEFHESLYDKFNEIARDYIMGHGVNALEIMLNDPTTGFIKHLNSKVISYRTQADNYHAQQMQVSTQAIRLHNNIQGMGNGLSGLGDYIQKLPNAFSTYLSQTRSMYEKTQSEEALTTLADVLEELSTDIKTNIISKTIPYAKAALRQIGEQVAEDVRSSIIPGGAMHVIDLERMRNDIRAAYENNDHQQQFREEVLSRTADVVLSPATAQDEDTAVDYVINALNGMIDNIFKAINDTTLASMLEDFGGINANGVSEHIQNVIAPMLERGASPHFALNPDYGRLNPTNSVICSYISIPEGATEVKNGIKEYISTNSYSGAVIKNSQINDRIFWMNVVAGLPLCAYAYLREYERVYLTHRGSRPGTHLIKVDQADLDRLDLQRTMLNDWNLLPSPICFKTLGDNPPQHDIERLWNENVRIIEEAEKAGVLVVGAKDEKGQLISGKEGKAFSDYGAKLQMIQQPGGQRIEEKDLEDRFKAIMAAGGDSETLLKALEDLMDSRVSYDQTGNPVYTQQQATRFAMSAGEAGIFEQDPGIQEKNFREVINYRLSKRPGLLLEIERQTKMQKPICAKMNELVIDIKNEQTAAEEAARKAEKAVKAVENVAKLLVFGYAKMLLNGVAYQDDMGNFKSETGEQNILINQNNTPFKGETWTNFIPLEARLVIWFSQQDPSEEPICSLLERCRNLTDELDSLEDTEEDRQRVHGYVANAEAILENHTKKVTLLKGQSKTIPKESYELAMKVMNQLKQSIEGIIAPWIGI